MKSDERRDKAAEQYQDEIALYQYGSEDFRSGWSARDTDIKNLLGLDESADLDQALILADQMLGKMKAALKWGYENTTDYESQKVFHEALAPFKPEGE